MTFTSLLPMAVASQASLDLSGEWRFALDRDNEGVAASWASTTLAERIRLPGLLTAQGFGDPVGMGTSWTGDLKPAWTQDEAYRPYQTADNFKMPYWLQPPRHYVGAAWYQRDFELPADWSGRRVLLHLERPHWETRVWLDGRELGRCDRLGVPHEYELGDALAPGRHTLSLRIDNRRVVDVGGNSHSISDHTQGNWNGVVGRIELRSTARAYLAEIRTFPSVSKHQLRIEVALGGAAEGRVEARVPGLPPVSTTASGGKAGLTLDLGAEARAWSEFSPVLYPLTVVLESPSGRDERTLRIGLSEIGTRGTRITLNDRDIFLRGTLECAIFPREGHPPTDVESWRRIIRICKAHGLNHIRFHSWCPPEAAFEAADELGFYYQVEASSWANQGAQVGSGLPLDAWLNAEAEAIVRAFGNHPSFVMFCYGNEPAGPKHKEWLAAFVASWKARDPRRLYTTGAGWPVLAGSDYHSDPAPRIQSWGQGLQSVINAEPPRSDYDWSRTVRSHADAPIVSHEIGQWCTYPNFREIAKYTGFFKAKNFEIFRDQARRNGVETQADDFLRVSGKLQALCYKADIEAALRTPGFGGFQLLDLHDFPGQGTALVGVLDAFWEEKGYISPAEYREFSGPLVPLARLPRMVYEDGDTLTAQVDLSQFGPADLPATAIAWRLVRADGGAVVASGALEPRPLPAGRLLALGGLSTKLSGFDKPARLSLELSVPGTDARNHWHLFVYPKSGDTPGPGGLRAVRSLDAASLDALARGGSLLWCPPASAVRGDPKHGPVKLGFSSIFWNTVWTDGQAPHTLGILADPAHPALADFPTEDHSDWQWWEILHGAAPFILSAHRDLKPIVQVVDDWVTSRKLGLVFEVRVGEGRLLVSGADLIGDLAARPAARQLRASLERYAQSAAFAPAVAFAQAELQTLAELAPISPAP